MKKILATAVILVVAWYRWGQEIDWLGLLLVVLAIAAVLILLAAIVGKIRGQQLDRKMEEEYNRRKPIQPKVQPQTPQVVMLPPGYMGGQPAAQQPQNKQATWTDLPPERYELL